MVAEYLVELGLDAGKERFKDKVDEHKLKAALLDYIKMHQKYNEVCALAEEIDFQGLVEYIGHNLLNSVTNRLFAPYKEDRGQAREDIVAAAISYSKADTDQARKRVAKCVYDCIDIIGGFYSSSISKKEYIIASEVVDAIEENTQTAVNASTQKILSRLNEIEEHRVNGPLFSIDKAVQLAETNNLSEIESGFTKVLDHISLTHPLYPHYGYTYTDEGLQSKPLTEDARKLYPPRYVFTGTVRFGNTYYTDSKIDPLEYAYRHQLSMTMDVSTAVKFLGTERDPRQSEVEGVRMVSAVPPKFPPAFPCAIKVGDIIFYDRILLRTQEILDDDTYVISNNEQGLHFYFEIRINPKAPNMPYFTISINHASNHEMLNYVRFMKALSEVRDIHVYVLEAEQDIIAGCIDSMEYKTGFTSVDEEIDFLERLCAIEDYFNVKLSPSGNISEEEYNKIIYISDLIQKGNVAITWSEIILTGTLDQRFREWLITTDSDFYMFSYVETDLIELFGASFEIKFMRSYKCAYIVDHEKVKKKAEILDDGDIIKITFRAGDDNSAIDTMSIPTKCLSGSR